jgi:L-ascorbate metabolism protein UlaG (beta-lactamase superfamily)
MPHIRANSRKDVPQMRIRWFGQSAFLLRGEWSVFIDPFGRPDDERLAARGIEFRYPPIEDVTADLVLVTHEHFDHNGVEVVGGAPAVLRSTAGRLESPVGEVVAIASEHDDVAGTARGPNTIFCFSLDGVRCCHLGDFGQPALRPEQRAAIGEVDVLMAPVGGGPTIGGAAAADVVRAIGPRLVVPMHYRTPGVNFLEPPDAFLDALGARVERQAGSEIDPGDLLDGGAQPAVALLAPPE